MYSNNYNRFHDDEDDYVDKQINDDQYTTQPYYNYQTTEYYNNYNTQQRQQPYVYTNGPPSYTFQPFSTTKSPYNFNSFSPQVTTKSPFNSNSFFYSTTTKAPINPPPTSNPYVGNYYFLKQQTTINPYNFANFGKPTNSPAIDEINNNHIKRSYVASNYFVDSSNVRNVTTIFNQRRH